MPNPGPRKQFELDALGIGPAAPQPSHSSSIAAPERRAVPTSARPAQEFAVTPGLARDVRGGTLSAMAQLPASRYAHRNTIFLLSPARCGGERGLRLIDGTSDSALTQQLHTESGAPLCDVFAFLSSLYFRGKLTYARAFARPPHALRGVFIITPGAGLLHEGTAVTAAQLRRFANVAVDHRNEHYVAPLLRDARALVARAGDEARFVLLGSIASGKYVEPLLEVFGERVLFPAEFVGRGDMSRGGLLLRAAREGTELGYLPVLGATRHGPRPARLPRLARTASNRAPSDE
jgi:hypothetical protein